MNYKYPNPLRLLLVFCLIGLSGCSTIQKSLSFLPGISNPDTTKIRSVEICTTASSNQDLNLKPSATQLDVLFILDSSVTDSLPKTAAEWFDDTNRCDYLTNNRETILPLSTSTGKYPSNPCDVSPIGLSPEAKSVKAKKLPKGYKKAKDVIAYANYFSSKGQKWLRLPNSKHAYIQLEPQNWSFASSCQEDAS